jgi:branched-chain amino acid transport system permease protein
MQQIRNERSWITYSVIILIACTIPFLFSTYLVSVFTEIMIMAIFALSLNILVGYTGLVSLGHAAFFGVGAYATGVIASQYSSELLISLLIGIVLSIVAAAVIGFFATRVSGFYFLMLTLAFSQMIYAIVYQWRNVTGGTNGLSGIPKPTMFGFSLESSAVFYFLILAFFVGIYFGLKRFLASPVGQILVGIRENETRMKTMGYNTTLYKNLAFIIAGAVGGLAGGFYAYFNGFVSPEDVYWTMSGEALIMVLVGGAGTLVGPVLGAAFIVLLETIVSSYTDLWMLIIGFTFIFFVIFVPKGIVGLWSGTKGVFLTRKSRIKKPRDHSVVKYNSSVEPVVMEKKNS